MPKLLLIDGNNMCHRVFWAQQNLSFKGRSVDVLFGFFRQLISLHKKFPDHFRIIAWDKGYARRLAESQKGVEAGIIPSAYKDNRDRDKAELESLYEQMDELKEGLKLTRSIQVTMEGIEADDIINSYAKIYGGYGWESVIVSSDRDFYQVLGNGITIYDAMKDETWNEERFKIEAGYDPKLHIDAGALTGDKGDNIHGADGWGPVTTNKYIQQYGDLESIIAAVQAKEKKSKKEQVLVDSIPKIRLARSLKAMDIIPNIPKPRIVQPVSVKGVESYFLQWGFASILKEAWRLA